MMLSTVSSNPGPPAPDTGAVVSARATTVAMLPILKVMRLSIQFGFRRTEPPRPTSTVQNTARFFFLMEQRAMRQQSMCRPRIAVIAAAVLSFTVSAFGQTGQLTMPAAVAPQGAQPVRRLTVDEAVKLAVDQNLGIQIQR